MLGKHVPIMYLTYTLTYTSRSILGYWNHLVIRSVASLRRLVAELLHRQSDMNLRALQIFAPKRHDNSQKVKKMRGLNINKVYAEVYDRYMLGTCSNIIYPISNPDVQRLCGELRYMLTIH